MKNYIKFLSVALLILNACQTKENELLEPVAPKVFVATIEDNEAMTRTSLSWINVHWTKGDLVSIFAGKTVNDKYQVTDESDGQSRADLYMVSNGNNTDIELAANIAYYPYMPLFTGVQTTDTGYNIISVLPDRQTYSEDSFGNGAFPMAAVTSTPEDCSLKFKNILGGVKLQLKGTAKISYITIKGNKDEILCGPVTVALSATEPPIILEFRDASFAEFVKLDCGDGVQLNTETATSFIIALPPMTMEAGFSLSIFDTDGNEMKISTSKPQTIARSSILKMPEITYEIINPVDISQNGTSNCYIVSSKGKYQFKPTKGNSQESVGDIESADVLWESFGTDITPKPGDLVSTVYYENGMINFTAKEKKGNAVIAAKDKNGEILWSWHIWLTDEPQEQVYNNEAGTMMDRNLGAPSATPGDVTALGLLYQWGRKDPFLGGKQISYTENIYQDQAASTITWPSVVDSDLSCGTISYAVSHPTTFISGNKQENHDWYYTGTYEVDNTRWQSTKTIYDPCPSGWRVPDRGIWSDAFGSTEPLCADWDDTNKGMDFSKTSNTLGALGPIWYPASGFLSDNGVLANVGLQGFCWTCTINPNPNGKRYCMYNMTFNYQGLVYPLNESYSIAAGWSVRCVKEQ